MDVTISRRLLVILHFFQCHYSQNAVPSCPQNRESWEAKNKTFGCYIDQKYHCLENTQGELVELCIGVISLQNKEGCPILYSINGYDSIRSRRCPDPAYFIGCPENSSGMYLSYETYNYPSCIKPEENPEWTSEPAEVKATASKSSGYVSHLKVLTSTSIPSPTMEVDYAKMKIRLFSGTQTNNNSGPVIGAVAAVIIVLIGVAGGFVFIRRRRKLNELIAEDVQYHNNTQILENYDDVRGIGFSPRTRVISLSTDDIARSLEEEEIATGRSEGTTDETVEDVDDEEVFMTFEQLQSARG